MGFVLIYCALEPMISIKTTDKEIIELDEQFAYKSLLLQNIQDCKESNQPIELLIDSKTMHIVYDFMIMDKHILKKDYNPLEIHFSHEMLHYFDSYLADDLLEICNAANYLEYPFLLELCCKILANELAANASNSYAEFPFKVLGDRRINEDDLDIIIDDFDWVDETS